MDVLIEKWTEQNIPSEFLNKFPALTSPKRQREFYHGRTLVKKAISHLSGQDPGWLAQKGNGLPDWPKEISGSISHSGDWAAVWIRRGSHALGVDLQTWLDESQAAQIEKAILTRTDIDLAKIPGTSRVRRMTLVFCIFEALQKVSGNLGNPAFKTEQIQWGSIDPQSKSWTMTIETEAENIKISGFWAENEEFCVAFGSV